MLGGVTVVDRKDVEREHRSSGKKEHKSSSKKRDSKDKKKEKRRKEASSRGRDRSASPARSSSGEDEPVARTSTGPEAQDGGNAAASGRDTWMTAEEPSDWFGAGAQAKPAAEDKPDPDAPRVYARELNPDLRPGGPPAPASAPSGPAIGDGGASWRLKALRRAQAAAAEAGSDVRAEVESRWGSMAQLTAGLHGQRAAHANAHLHAARDRARGDEGRRAYLEDVSSDRGRMRRADLSGPGPTAWRKGSGSREQGGRQGAGRSDGPRGEKEAGDGDKGERRRTVEASSTRRADPDSSRGQSREAGRSRHDSRPSGHAAPSRQRDAILQGAAKAINAFANDGSFMATALDARGKSGASEDVEAGPSASSDDGTDDERSRRREAAADERKHSSAAQPAATPAPAAGGNLGAAAALRARLLGKAAPPAEAPPRPAEELLPLVDARGRAVPGAFGRETASAREPQRGPTGRRPPARTDPYAPPEDGARTTERQRYFADDDDPGADVASLAKRARHGDDGAGDLDRAMARGIARSGARFRGVNADDEYDHDAGAELLERGARRGGRRGRDEDAAARDRARQVGDFRRQEGALARCERCFTGGARPRHLTLAIGQRTYLALPPRGRLVPGHCQILPMDHVASARRLDEDAWTEVRNFKKCLIQMNIPQGMDVIFVETAMRLGDARSHTVIDCVPVPMELSPKAPMVFKKSIDDATSEWAQHHAKRFIDTSTKGLRGCIPDNFPYLNVDFGLGSGFVHVIDDEQAFDPGLARSVLVGLLRLPETKSHGHIKAEAQSVQERWAREFRAEFQAFDWTKMLD